MATTPIFPGQPSPQELRELLEYFPETGVIIRRPRVGPIKKSQRLSDAGTVFGSKTLDGYLRGSIRGQGIMAHRVAWTLHYGEWPTQFIDHINGDRTDNRIENLRLATRVQNNRNSAVRKDSMSGEKGVIFRRGQWEARIRHDGKTIHIGTYLTQSECIAAFRAAALILHKEFKAQDHRMSRPSLVQQDAETPR